MEDTADDNPRPACRSGCCAPETPAKPVQDDCCLNDADCDPTTDHCGPEENGSSTASADACKDGCCSTARPEVVEATKCVDKDEGPGCCSSTTPLVSSEKAECGKKDQDEDCCSPQPEPNAVKKPGCCTESQPRDGCCKNGTEASTDEGATCGNTGGDGCCTKDPQHKPSRGAGCCDDSCLEKIALRECQVEHNEKDGSKLGKGCSIPANSKGSSTETSHMEPTPCRYHRETTRQRYQTTLEAIGCICKALLARNLESCCSSSPLRVRKSRSLRTTSSRSSIDSCCAGSSSAVMRLRNEQGRVRSRSSSGKRQGCCSAGKCGSKSNQMPLSTKPPRRSSDVSDDCCARKSSTDSCADKDCCRTEVGQIEPGNSPDIERGPTCIERVVLSVQGMTCTGCEKKLIRAIEAVPTVTNIKSSLVLARAEFDLDTGTVAVDDAISRLKKITNFSFQKIEEDAGQTLDVYADDPENLGTLSSTKGVTHIENPDKKNRRLLRIHYNGGEIGARDLFEQPLPSRIELAPPQPDPAIRAGKLQVRKEGLFFLVAAIFTIPVLVFAWAPIPNRESVTYQSISLAFATIIQAGVAQKFYPAAFNSLFRSRIIEMDLLIVLSTSAAYAFSVVAFAYLVTGNPLSTGAFFETSTLLATLIVLGRFISEVARHKATESISIRSLQVQTALLLNKDKQGTRDIDARLLQHGDVFRVVPHSRIATDGVVISGESEVDESMVTGESTPVPKCKQSPVIAGSMNGAGTLDVALTALPGQNTISTIAKMVDEAELSKPKIQATADKVAGYFVPCIVVLTITIFIIWVLVGRFVQHKSGGDAAVQALTYAIATLIISCPCAIGLAVPMVVVIAGGVAAKHGIVFKAPQAIETAFRTTHVVFDKTGTLTQGCMSVIEEQYFDLPKEYTASSLLGLVADVKHPVSVALAEHLAAQGIHKTALNNPQVATGRGVEAEMDGKSIQAGNCRWLAQEEHPAVKHLLQKGLTVFCVAIDNKLCAVFGLADAVRPEARDVVSVLLARGISVSMISGDDQPAVEAIAAQLGISASNARARCSPGEKQAYIKDLLADDKNVVVFCGDGTNDAVALAQSTLGIHMNTGSATDIARSAADVVLVRPDLTGITTMIDISRAAYVRILFNFGWAGIYNLFAILLAAGAFVRARIPPEFAGLGEICSVLPVVLIAFGLKFLKFRS